MTALPLGKEPTITKTKHNSGQLQPTNFPRIGCPPAGLSFQHMQLVIPRHGRPASLLTSAAKSRPGRLCRHHPSPSSLGRSEPQQLLPPMRRRPPMGIAPSPICSTSGLSFLLALWLGSHQPRHLQPGKCRLILGTWGLGGCTHPKPNIEIFLTKASILTTSN